MKQKILEAALWYQKQGYSVIPLRQNKKPFLKEWKPYQTKRASVDQIKKWWGKWPKANIGLVTGEISRVDAVDCDSIDGKDALNEYVPDTLITTIATTPDGGWHYLFKHSPGLSNGVRIITDCDVRTTGGYIVAPPSYCEYEKGDRQIKGSHEWIPGLSIEEISPAPMPEMLFDILQAGGMPASPSKDEHIRCSNPLYKNNPYIEGQHKVNVSSVNTRSTRVNKVNISFDEGSRDESLFHLANYLVKAGMSESNIRDT